MRELVSVAVAALLAALLLLSLLAGSGQAQATPFCGRYDACESTVCCPSCAGVQNLAVSGSDPNNIVCDCATGCSALATPTVVPANWWTQPMETSIVYLTVQQATNLPPASTDGSGNSNYNVEAALYASGFTTPSVSNTPNSATGQWNYAEKWPAFAWAYMALTLVDASNRQALTAPVVVQLPNTTATAHSYTLTWPNTQQTPLTFTLTVAPAYCGAAGVADSYSCGRYCDFISQAVGTGDSDGSFNAASGCTCTKPSGLACASVTTTTTTTTTTSSSSSSSDNGGNNGSSGGGSSSSSSSRLAAGAEAGIVVAVVVVLAVVVYVIVRRRKGGRTNPFSQA